MREEEAWGTGKVGIIWSDEVVGMRRGTRGEGRHDHLK